MSTSTKSNLDSYAAADGARVLHERIAAAMADAVYAHDPAGPAWMIAPARQHVLNTIDGPTEGGVMISVASLHLVMGYVRYLEQVAALQTPQGAA